MSTNNVNIVIRLCASSSSGVKSVFLKTQKLRLVLSQSTLDNSLRRLPSLLINSLIWIRFVDIRALFAGASRRVVAGCTRIFRRGRGPDKGSRLFILHLTPNSTSLLSNTLRCFFRALTQEKHNYVWTLTKHVVSLQPDTNYN